MVVSASERAPQVPCYGPLTAYYPKRSSNDRRLVFKASDSETGIPLRIPCGKCVGCRLEQSRQWAVRCMHEKRLHNASAFLTLTYAKMPPGNSLQLADYQNFLKRLRHHTGTGLRFFGCGEYGSITQRPHYHLLLLNSDFNDKKIAVRGTEYNLYASPLLSKLWPHGHHTIGNVDFHSAAYVARYCVKKNQNGKLVNDGRLPEFVTMSRRPGLGHGYFDRFRDEILNHDNIIVNGVPAALPRFYDNKLGQIDNLIETRAGHLLTLLEMRKFRRRQKISWSQRKNSGTTRLRVREVVALAKLNLKKRAV